MREIPVFKVWCVATALEKTPETEELSGVVVHAYDAVEAARQHARVHYGTKPDPCWPLTFRVRAEDGTLCEVDIQRKVDYDFTHLDDREVKERKP